MIFRRPQRSEWAAAARLLTAANLPLAGAREHFADFLGVWADDRLLGLAGLEVYGEDALVRSVVVTDQARGKGLGQELVQRILAQGYAAGVRRYGLLTTTAAEFFLRFGFLPVRREELPPSLHGSAEFQGACPQTAAAMLLQLSAPPVQVHPAVNTGEEDTHVRNPDETRELVRTKYAQAAKGAGAGGCCGSSLSDQFGCCGGVISVDDLAKTIGYGDADLALVPEGANLGLGCGNPQAIASLKPGETVLDLGSGAGFDCFLAARQVGEAGRVIGIDMTPEMLAKARQNARSGGITNVEFRLGEIEHMPVADMTVDVIISNCVINLSPEKEQVFAEAFRVLKSGGRLAVSDMVTSMTLPPNVQQDLALYTGCIAGAASMGDLEAMLRKAGFAQIRIEPKDSRELLQTWGADTKLEQVVFSANIQAVRPL